MLSELDSAPVEKPLDIVYQDEYLVAVNKPAGLLVHRSMLDKHETRFALQMVRNQVGQHVYPVHRLDKPTSGVLLFALSSEIARMMVEKFAQRETGKTYLAVVRGYTLAQDSIDYALKEELDKKADKHAQRDKPAQEAVTHYQKLADIELPYAVGRYPTTRYSLLQLCPQTGRKHQLRRHMKHIFHPIVGDTTHGDGKHNHFFREELHCKRLLLAATSLAFAHPISGEKVTIQAGVGDDFQTVLERFSWNV